MPQLARSARRASALLAALAALAAAAPGRAETLAAGSPMPPLALPDQHGNPHTLDAKVRLVLFSHDMDGGGVIKEALERDGFAFLERHRAVYVADVHRMPGLIRRLVALPRLRARPYPIWLDEEGLATAEFPRAEAKATLLFLAQRRVRAIEFAGSADELLLLVRSRAGGG